MSAIASNMDRTPLDIIVPILMYCVILFWIGRRFTWTQRLTISVVTLTLILIVVLIERGGF
jgi:hypothetical protein